jgi:hypothetical protein
MQHAHLRLVIAQGGRAQSGDQSIVVAAGGLEKPAAHRIEDGREGIESLLHAREAAESAVETDGPLRRLRRVHESPHQLDGLPRLPPPADRA